MGREKKTTTAENTAQAETKKIPKYKHIFKITLLEEMLGTSPNNETIYGDWVASKAPTEELTEEEIAGFSVNPEEDKGTTIFLKAADGKPFIYEYWIDGFFKHAGRTMNKTEGSLTKKKKAFIKEIDDLMTVAPRQIPIDMHGMKMGLCERPLRAQTPQGERVALARSETVPEGSTLKFVVKLYDDSDIELIHEWLNTGTENGLGQWRNSGKGRFVWEEYDRKGNVIAGNVDDYYADIKDDEELLEAVG